MRTENLRIMRRKRNKFALSYGKLWTANMGELIPTGLLEVLPGDGIQHSTSNFLRTIALVAPPMHQVDMYTHHYFIPNRLVWDDWEDFITGGEDNDDTSVFPTVDLSTAGRGQPAAKDLSDYLGLPVGTDLGAMSALPFRMYALLWNEIYRDQDIQDELVISTASGADTTTSLALQRANWEKDYFTRAKPWPQKGDAQTVSLGTSARVATDATDADDMSIWSTDTNAYQEMTTSSSKLQPDPAAGLEANRMYADLSAATGIEVTDLYQAIRLQDMAQARALYGSKYVEYIRYIGGNPQDYRFQRPEYLGGGKQAVQFSEVLQTAEGTNPVGHLYGHGIGVSRSNRYRFQVPEHGYIISVSCIKPRTMYADGIPQHYLRTQLEDYWQLELQNIGQRAVLNKEVYAAHGTPDGTFGYADRYDEYRRGVNTIAGAMRNTLAAYHFGRQFSTDPALNSDFLECDPPKTPFSVTTADHHPLLIDTRHSIQARRVVTNDPTPMMAPRY